MRGHDRLQRIGCRIFGIVHCEESRARRGDTRRRRSDTRLVAGLRASATGAADDDGWANLSTVGSLMRKQQPDFDPRNWGYAKLSDLVRATDLFAVEPRNTGGLQIRDKRKNGG
ncbi:OST-HTH/LOTUS domain-containing protein [Microbacterium sp.]|uniref:OST-HTH/LOTUS domain-containing protein n=1 Tax=Microbacterium sp. TaxID=51671 RepID=UPI003A8FDD0D